MFSDSSPLSSKAMRAHSSGDHLNVSGRRGDISALRAFPVMPGRRVHEWLDKLVLGRAHPEVHRLMDSPSLVLGKRHRVLFHSPLELVLLFGDDPEKLAAALLHVWLDREVTRALLSTSKLRRKRRRRKRRQ